MNYTKEILIQFVTESKEYLETIEDDLRNLEKHKDNPDPELVNKVFRVLHTIKEGAGFLGLKNINDLAFIMGNMFSLLRAGEIEPESVIINALLEGADCLNDLLDVVEYSNDRDISGVCKHLSNLFSGEVSEQVKKELNTNVALSDVQGENIGFEINEFTLKYLSEDKKFLYVLKYDLMELAKSERKTPLWLIRLLLRKGDIIEGRLETSIEDLHEGLPMEPLLYDVLYSTSLDPDQIQKATGLPGCGILQVSTLSKETGTGKHKKSCFSTLGKKHVKVISGIAVDETPFFKDYHLFSTFRDYILPRLGKGLSIGTEGARSVNPKGPRIRIWGVGVGVGAFSGQELYNIAVLVYEYVKNNASHGISVNDFSILATDESSRALARAIRGKYSDIEISRGPCAGKKTRYFKHEPNGISWIIHDWIRSMVEFRQINLTTPFTFLGNFDVIFCFNTLNSFDTEAKREIIRQFFSMLSENGCLLPGTNKELFGRTIARGFELIKYGETLIYKKRNK